jgi:hypothetical protein
MENEETLPEEPEGQEDVMDVAEEEEDHVHIEWAGYI